jgi:hypothetical protein
MEQNLFFTLTDPSNLEIFSFVPFTIEIDLCNESPLVSKF